ncbi:hypothetical protein ACTG23_19220 [Aeromonas enteropelogenes]|uniref:hypothetical protein n=1 Tax=Aeromonas enteropelogenes TaxID=29489 RepID=UPI003F795F20
MNLKELNIIKQVKCSPTITMPIKRASDCKNTAFITTDDKRHHFLKFNPCFKADVWYLDIINQRLGEKKMKEFVVTAVFTVFFTLVAVSLPSLSQF